MHARKSLKTLVRLASPAVEHDYRGLKTGLSLDHFEGGSFLGWYRHVTLTVLARAFCTLLRLDPEADAPARPSETITSGICGSQRARPPPATRPISTAVGDRQTGAPILRSYRALDQDR